MNSYKNGSTIGFLSNNPLDMNDILASVSLDNLSNGLAFIVTTNDLTSVGEEKIVVRCPNVLYHDE